ncbi:MAG: peptidase, partial [Erysipelothrix sp.]|nr:peptidase [Erysipelothrix sp.]
IVSLRITRGPVLSSAYGEMVGEDIGYLEISSFSLQTGEEVKYYLEEMANLGATKLIIDVRDNGGGYLSTLNQIASFFLEEEDIVIIEQFRDGNEVVTYSNGEVFENFEEIVMLANEYSASASEVLTAALKDNLDIKVVGVTTYGKGTVQVTSKFDDGSALKYTTAQWLTPKGNQIHGIGIKPSVEMRLHEVFYQPTPTFEEGEPQSFKVDSVSESIIYVQYALDFLGYTVDRYDGYFSEATNQALIQYQKDLQMRTDGIVNAGLISSLSSSIVREWHLNSEIHDVQYQMALELISH